MVESPPQTKIVCPIDGVSDYQTIRTGIRHFPDRPIVCASGLGGLGRTNDLCVRSSGNIYFCGDGESDMSLGLCASRVGIAAQMQANVAIELLVQGHEPVDRQ